jgi:hypothetical protein
MNHCIIFDIKLTLKKMYKIKLSEISSVNSEDVANKVIRNVAYTNWHV